MSKATSQLGIVQFKMLDEANLMEFLKIRNSVRDRLHDNREFSLENCKEWFRTKEQTYWLVIWQNRTIGYFRFQVDKNDRNLGIIGMELDLEFKSKGGARLLYKQFCTEILTQYGVNQLALRVLKLNTLAIALYASMGMAISEETQVDYEMQTTVEQLLVRLN